MARARLTRAELRLAKRTTRALLETTAAEVASLPPTALRELIPVLKEAEREVALALRKWMDEVPGGDTRFSAHEYRRVLIHLRRAKFEAHAQLSRAPRWVLRIKEKLFGALNKVSDMSGRMATEHLVTEFSMLSQAYKSPYSGSIPIKSASIMAQGDKMLIPRFANSASRYAGRVWNDLRRQLAVGISRNETVDQLTSRLARLGGPKTVNAAEGLFRRYRWAAERVVRTETINAYNVQHAEGIRQAHEIDDEVRQRWDSSLDSRLCVICYDLHGEIVGVGEDFPGGYPHPPAHPNCRCVVVAWHEEWGIAGNLPHERLTPEIHQEA